MANRLDAVLAVLQPGDVLVGHSGGGMEITWRRRRRAGSRAAT